MDPEVGPIGEFRPEFDQLVLGGFGFSGLLDQSIKTRHTEDIFRDNALIWDLSHPDAFRNTGKRNVEALTEEDLDLNVAAFSDAGHARGLDYNLFCAGHASLPDGRLVVIGGHDKNGNAGIRKVNIFNPATEAWEPRLTPPVKAAYLADPTGEELDHPDPLDESNTDPPAASDMTYQRWYPTAVTLPNGLILVLSGSDLDTSVGADAANATKVRQAVPEIVDPTTGETIALENARKLLPMYPRSFVVQTGPGRDDWKVAVVGQIEPPLPDETEILEYDPFRYSGKTYLFDVQAALADPQRDQPAEAHWELIAEAQHSHEDGASAAIWELDEQGLAQMQKVVLFGGNDQLGDFDEVAAVESIDLASEEPTWTSHEPLVRRAARNHAVVLPDGNVLVHGGRIEDEEAGVVETTLEYELFDPSSGELRTVAVTTVPRHDHATMHLLPDGTVIAIGGNRVELAPGNPSQAVPVAQVYRPSYLFRGPRPEILAAPDELAYGSRFEVQIDPAGPPVDRVVLIRYSPLTHNWSWGYRYLRMPVDVEQPGVLGVSAPAQPGIAPPGQYMLFAVTADGVPSVARKVVLPVPTTP